MEEDDKGCPMIRMGTIRYDTRCYFNVRSKADISQLNLPHGCEWVSISSGTGLLGLSRIKAVKRLCVCVCVCMCVYVCVCVYKCHKMV